MLDVERCEGCGDALGACAVLLDRRDPDSPLLCVWCADLAPGLTARVDRGELTPAAAARWLRLLRRQAPTTDAAAAAPVESR